MLFFSRTLDGFTGGNISVAQAYITDVTSEEDRARGLGLVGAAFGLGFVFGPFIGGVLSGFGFAVPAFFAAGLAAINLLMVAYWLPESLPEVSLILALGDTTGVAQLIPEIVQMSEAKAVIAPIDHIIPRRPACHYRSRPEACSRPHQP